MFKKLIILCLTMGLSGFVAADSVRLSADAPETYVVKKGDTLWDIAGLYLEKPWHWPTLWQHNPAIKNPHLIYPGDMLSLSWIDGKPVLSYTSGGVTTDSAPINGASTALLRQYLTYDSLIAEQDYRLAPRVLGTGEGWSYISTRTPFFVDMPLENQDWYIYRPITHFDREVGKDDVVRMISLKKVGEAKLVRALEEISELKLVKQNQEIKPNDIMLPALGAKTGEIFHPQPAPSGISGKVIGHLYGSNYVGLRQIVVVDRGEADGLNAGHTLSVIMPGAALKGGKGDMRYDSDVDNAADPVQFNLPSRSAGTLLVIRSYPQFSLAMVVDAVQPLKADMPVMAAEG